MRTLCSAVVYLALCAAAFPQTPATTPNSPTKQEALTTLRSETTLVIVPAVVHDRNGKHVPGLTRDDFVVLEDGKPQVITSVEEVWRPGPIPPNPAREPEFTNQTPSAGSPGILIIVFDRVNTSFSDQVYGRDKLLQFLETFESDGRPMMLLTLEPEGPSAVLRVIHDFTDDVESLRAAVKSLRGGAAAAHLAPLTGVIQDRHTAVSASLSRLRELAAAVQGIRGRKALVWATAGMAGHNEEIGQTWRAFNEANVAVYPIDLRGLVVPTYLGAIPREFQTSLTMQSSRVGFGMYGLVSRTRLGDSNTNGRPGADRLEDWNIWERTGSLREVAHFTGGIPCVGTNDLENCLRMALDNSGTYYLLSFRPPKTGAPKWHELAVKVKRPDVKVNARSGYSTFAASKRGSNPDLLLAAIFQPLQQTALPLRVKTAKKQAGDRLQVEYDVAIQDLHIDRSDSNHVYLDVSVSAFNLKGERLTATSKTVEGRLNAKGLAQAMSSGLPYAAVLSLPADASLVVFGVRDNLSGRIGTVRAQVSAIPVQP